MGKSEDIYNDYTFSLSNVLKSTKALEVFKVYLKQTHNLELVEFLQSVSQYKMEIKGLYEQFMGETVDLEHNIKMEKMENRTSNPTTDLDITSDAVIQMNQENVKLGKTFHNSIPVEVFVHIHKQFATKAKNLIDTYLTPAGPKEINFSGAVKSQMLEQYRVLCEEYQKAVESNNDEKAKITLNDVNLKHRQYNLFAGLENVVIHMLRSDVFPRFTRTDAWFKFLKKNKKILDDIAVKSGEEFSKMLYTPEDYYNPMITDQDFDSLRYFLQDSPKWKLKLIVNPNGPIADRSYYYAMDDSFIIGDNLPKNLKNRKLGKLVIYLPCDAIDAAHFIFGSQYQTAIDETCKKLMHVGYFNADKSVNRKYALSLIELHYKFFPKPCDKRLYRFTWSLIVDPLDTSRLLFVGRTNQTELEAPTGFVDSSCYFGWCIKQVEKNLTCFTQVFSVNLGGKIQDMPQWMNNTMMDHVYKERAKNMSKLMKKLLFERAAHGWPEVTETFGRLDTLLENCKNLNNTFKAPEDKDISGLSLWDFEKKELKKPSHKIREGTTL